MEKPEDLVKKVEVYKYALEEVKKELTQKRTELGTLAQTTVEHLETSIPELRKQAEEQQQQVAYLDKLIAEKNQEVQKERDVHKGHYENLEKMLRDEYTKRLIEQNARDLEIENRIKSNKNLISELELREIQLVNGNETLSNLRKSFEQEIIDFNVKKKEELENIENKKNEINKTEMSIKSKKEDIIKLQDKANEVLVKLEERERLAELTITRIKEVEEGKEEISRREKRCLDKEVKLNELNIKIIASKKKLDLFNDELEEKEKNLNEREANLKIAESFLNK